MRWFAGVAGITAKDRLNKLIKKAEAVVGSKLPRLEEVRRDRMLAKALAIMDNAAHPLHETVKKGFQLLQQI